MTKNYNAILTLATASLFLVSCAKQGDKTNTTLVSAVAQQQNSEIVISKFINSKYEFLESDAKEINLTPYFETANLATKLATEYALEKQNLLADKIKYTAHTTKLVVKTVTKNDAGSETLAIEENTNLTTNQVSIYSGKTITSVKQQLYSITVSVINNEYKITALIDIDKQTMDNKRIAAEAETLSKEDIDEINDLANSLNKTMAYSKANAAAYAVQYGIAPNPVYQDFSPGMCSYCGGDCTSFISQCALAGGWAPIYKKASSAAAWWYGKNTNPVGYRTGFAGVWPSASKFGVLLKSLTTRVTRVYSLSTLVVGDLGQLVWTTNGNAHHSFIVTDKDRSGNLYFTCHTYNRINTPQSTWFNSTTNYSGITPDAFLWQMK